MLNGKDLNMHVISRAPNYSRRAWRRRWILALACAPMALAIWITYVFGTNNFHAVIEGEVYRAGQMSSNDLARCIRRHGIRSVINLRGEHPREAWYRDEREAARALNVAYRSLALSARHPASRAEMQTLDKWFVQLPKPILIHCDGGADRTAMASAIYLSDIARQPAAKAERQFSMWYGYLPFIWKEKARLRESFREHAGHKT